MFFSMGVMIHRRQFGRQFGRRRRRRRTEVEQKKKRKAIIHIPEEVLEQILSRIAVKSLLRLKSVCKAWYNLISSKDFTFLHLNSYKPCDILVAGTIRNSQKNRILMSVISVPTEAEASASAGGCAASRITMVNHLLPKEMMVSYYHLSVRPCNGIFCLYNFHDMLLWNPAINDFKVIPQSIPCSVPRRPISSCSVDLGFDPKTNDFKILHIWYDFSSAYQHQLQLYSLATDSWRNLDASIFNSFRIHCGWPRFTTNTIFGWFAFDSKVPAAASRPYKLYLFDLSSETFDMVPVPIEGDIVCSEISLLPFRESIAALIPRPPQYFGCFEIWALNHLSSSSTQSRSWSKLWTIQPQHLQRRFQPLGFWGSSYFIARRLKDCNLDLYDLVNHDVVDLGAGVPKASMHMPAIYQESLIRISDKKRAAKIVI